MQKQDTEVQVSAEVSVGQKCLALALDREMSYAIRFMAAHVCIALFLLGIADDKDRAVVAGISVNARNILITKLGVSKIKWQ